MMELVRIALPTQELKETIAAVAPINVILPERLLRLKADAKLAKMGKNQLQP